MNSREIPENRLWAWVFAAMTAPLVTAASGTPWWTVLAVGLAGSLLSLGVFACPRSGGKLFWTLQWLFAVFLLSRVLGLSKDCWQVEAGSGTLIPLTLLLLALCASCRGPDRPARIGSVLFWLLAVTYGALLATGIPGIHPKRLHTDAWRPATGLAISFLIPSAAALFPRGGKKPALWFFLLPLLLAVAVSLCSFGTLSAPVAEKAPLGFYEAVRGMGFFGVAERYESFLSAALTLGWFGIFSFLLSIAEIAASGLGRPPGEAGVWVAGAAALALYFLELPVPAYVADGLGVTAWCVLPVVTGILKKRKKN